MHPYGVRDVEKLLRLPRSTIRSLVQAGFVAPARGPRNAWRFSFQDLVVLRTARALAQAQVPSKRITRAIRGLKRQLPEAMPLSGLAICAVGDRVVVREGDSCWQADSGQYLLALGPDFAQSSSAGMIAVVEPSEIEKGPSAESLCERAMVLEESDTEEAVRLYAAAIVADRHMADAYVNLGRLLHELGRSDQAERVYRAAIEAGLAEPLLHFNLGVLLEDSGRGADALAAYEAVLQTNPRHADALHNAGLLADELGRAQEAIRYMAQYRRLLRKPK
ncbi:MAG TPA: tetratricopeptide repeat protein [Burkholderiaceae bacterium]|nr:tetratricopeptide repeat protein [Burkholderiaceae bacterium]